MCSHYYIENQLSEIQTQISTIYTTISQIILRERRNEDNLENVVALLNSISRKYDSETNQNKVKESGYEENN